MSKANSEDYDVLVIGGGLSGLSAARRLKTRLPDLKVLVLEASDHVGGRTRTVAIKGPQGQDDTVDLGGQWVCDTQPDIMALLKEFGIGSYPQNVKGRKVLEVGDNKVRTYCSEIPNLDSYVALIQLQLMINKAESLCQQVDIRDPYACPMAHDLDSCTVATFIHKHTGYQSVYDIFNTAIVAVFGCEATQISTLFFLAYANGAGGVMKLMLVENGAAQEYRVKGGTQQISLRLLQELEGEKTVRLNSAVKEVHQEDGKVTVKCKDGSTFTAKRVICTTPSNQTACIEFHPAMPSARKSLYKNFYLGNLSKVWVLYKTSFWLEDGFSGEVVSTGGLSNTDGCEKGPVNVWYDATTDKGTPALVGLFGGRNVDQWFDKSPEVRKAAVIKQLVNYYGPKAAEPLDYIDKSWNEERYVAGAPAVFCPPGSMHNYHLFRTPLGLVHFAGTELATKWPGYMSGAVNSGYRAAAEVIQALNSKALTGEDKELLEDYKPKAKKDYRLIKRETFKVGWFGCDNKWVYMAVFVAVMSAFLAWFKFH